MRCWTPPANILRYAWKESLLWPLCPPPHFPYFIVLDNERGYGSLKKMLVGICFYLQDWEQVTRERQMCQLSSGPSLCSHSLNKFTQCNLNKARTNSTWGLHGTNVEQRGHVILFSVRTMALLLLELFLTLDFLLCPKEQVILQFRAVFICLNLDTPFPQI